MGTNANLNKAKAAKNDEFYTGYDDIANELKHYEPHFKNKIVYCNCDDPKRSNFWKYLHNNFSSLGLKKLISTHYEPNKPQSYAMTYKGGDDLNTEAGTITPLEGNGDFRNAECIELLKESDIVVTNPPFSLFREYTAQLMEYEKKFLIIGNLNAVTYKEFFPWIRDNKIWMGSTYFNGGAAYFIAPKELYDPNKMYNPKNAYLQDGLFYWRVNGVRWYTNLEHSKRHEKLLLWKRYTPDEYPKYDNYNAINVDKVSDIPCDYEPCWFKCPHVNVCRYAQTEGKENDASCESACNGIIGVPISFLDKYCSEQFRIVGVFSHGKDGPWDFSPATINGEKKYKRLAVRKQIIQPRDPRYRTNRIFHIRTT